ncbi:MAG: DNA (cytosine-5-)-methyltransferase [Candidatus Methanogranum gryphiswaldense]|nr:MAG: DNA (cytosine-5-)-methyltransferase [Candidatus Methanogranum sp. U3.2.1]
MVEKIRVVELFAGVGGFRVGLETASDRFETIWADQWEPDSKTQFAFNCYNSHFSGKGSKNVNEDIGIAKKNVPDHDLLVGGFPCQDYSVASTGAKGIEGKKGVLWWHIDDIIKAHSPKYVLLENVDRLLKSPASQRGRDFGVILRCLADNGYYVEWRVINAADYGMVQRRRRTFIFACKKDLDFVKSVEDLGFEEIVSTEGFFADIFPVKGMPIQKKVNEFSISDKDYPTLVDLSDSFEESFFSAGVMKGKRVYTREIVPVRSEDQIMLRTILESDVDERYYIKDPDKWKYLKGSKKLERTSKQGHKYCYSEGAISFPDNLDMPARTMLTSEGTVNRSSHLICDPNTGRLRRLTPLECERINGFPDGWTDVGMTDRQRYFVMGNALVVGVIECMGRKISIL